MGDIGEMGGMGNNHTTRTPILNSQELTGILEGVINFGCNTLLCLMGIVTNALTIIVFTKMGFKETSNITMTAIAFWNFFKCILTSSFCMNYILRETIPKYTWWTYFSMSLLCLHGSDVTLFITNALSAYVAVERCLCVSLPFTVRHLLTRKTVTSICIAISVCTMGGYIIFFAVLEFGYQHVDNVTAVFRWIPNDFYYDRPEIELYVKLYGQIIPVASIGITSLCTLVIIYKLRKSSKFRSGAKRQDASSQLSARDTKVIKMLLVVVLVYIACSIPYIALLIPQLAIRTFSEDLYTRSLFFILRHVVTSFALVDASTNLFIFYNMSSEFHNTLRRLLFRTPTEAK